MFLIWNKPVRPGRIIATDACVAISSAHIDCGTIARIPRRKANNVGDFSAAAQAIAATSYRTHQSPDILNHLDPGLLIGLASVSLIKFCAIINE